jgi:ATP phosphoribosyltransferase regulatory subunit
MLAIATEIFERLGLQNRYRITISSVEVFNGIAERLALDKSGREKLRHLVDIRDAAELQQFLRSAQAQADTCAAFSRLMQLPGRREVLETSRRLITNPRSVEALCALDELWSVIERLGLSHAFEIDLGDVSGLDYYTGLTFKIYVEGAGSRLGGGGRYDGLTANFGRPEPAIGFMLDLNALTEVLMRTGTLLHAANHAAQAAPIVGPEPSALFLEAGRRRQQNERVRVELKG